MSVKWLHILVVVALLLAPSPARAEGSTLERFTKTMVFLYVTAEMCKQVEMLHSENLSNAIRAYLSSYYQKEIPYWVLPEVHGNIKDTENCIFYIREGLDRYKTESVEYATNYPTQPVPPTMAVYLTNGNNSIDSEKAHYVTPSSIN